MSTVEDCQKHVQSIVSLTGAGVGLALGAQTGLLQTLVKCGGSSFTAQQLADKAGMKERYVREWLSIMACSKVISVDATGTQFTISAEMAQVLGDDKNSGMLRFLGFMPDLTSVTDNVAACFPKDGPRGTTYAMYKNFHSKMAEFTTGVFATKLIPDFVPLLPEDTRKLLDTGAKVMDVCCGIGVPSAILAKQYPNSRFEGVDFSKEAVERATADCAASGLKNTSFCTGDAAKLPAEWSNTYDLVTVFDAIHDNAYPQKVLSEIHRILKPGGIFAMVDINMDSNVANNQQHPVASFVYFVSLFHCMPVSYNFEDGVGLGTCWGRQKAAEMLKEAKFDVLASDSWGGLNVYFVCKKP